MKKYKIANLVFELDLCDEYLHPYLSDFLYDGNDSPEFSIISDIDTISKKDAAQYVIEHTDDRLISSDYMSVLRTDKGYRFYYPHTPSILFCDVDTVTNYSCIYLASDAAPKGPLHLIDYIFHAIRDIFFTYSQLKGLLMVHSSTVIYKDKAYLFSARSGTGKTTHTNFWVDSFDVTLLNGDVAALTIENGQAFAHGIPWCGTSQKYQNRKVPLGGIIFLSQAKENALTELSTFEAIVSLAARSFSPSWTKEQTNLNFALSEEITHKAFSLHLDCLPNMEAALLVKNYIDLL